MTPPAPPHDTELKMVVATNTLAITRRNQAHSPLLRLPSELRNQIYEYVLSVGMWKLNPGAKALAYEETEHHYCNEGIRSGPNQLALLGTCQQLYHETELLPFTLNTVYFQHVIITKFLKKLTQRQRAAVRRIFLHPIFETPYPFVIPKVYLGTLTMDVQLRPLAILPNLCRIVVKIHTEFGMSMEKKVQAKKEATERLEMELREGVMIEVRMAHQD